MRMKLFTRNGGRTDQVSTRNGSQIVGIVLTWARVVGEDMRFEMRSRNGTTSSERRMMRIVVTGNTKIAGEKFGFEMGTSNGTTRSERRMMKVGVTANTKVVGEEMGIEMRAANGTARG